VDRHVTSPLPSRREFIAGIAMLGGLVGLLKTLPKADQYQPIGHLKAGDLTAQDVETVTVDGRLIERVFELDDVEGWVRHYVPVDRHYPWRLERLTGQVRVTWKDA
jgi:hypothetical protein